MLLGMSFKKIVIIVSSILLLTNLLLSQTAEIP